jgi:hypothetical protein
LQGRNVKITIKKDTEQMEMHEKKSHTSFGKLILADESNAPIFSILNFYPGFSGADRFPKIGGMVEFKPTPGPIYSVTDEFKFHSVLYN